MSLGVLRKTEDHQKTDPTGETYPLKTNDTDDAEKSGGMNDQQAENGKPEKCDMYVNYVNLLSFHSNSKKIAPMPRRTAGND